MNEKKFYRNKDKALLGGICAGLGDFFEIDPNIVRLAFLLFGWFSWGTGLVIYFLACLILPKQED